MNPWRWRRSTAQLGGIAAFGDEMRDGLRGGWRDDKEGAFLIGIAGNEESVKFGVDRELGRENIFDNIIPALKCANEYADAKAAETKANQ